MRADVSQVSSEFLAGRKRGHPSGAADAHVPFHLLVARGLGEARASDERVTRYPEARTSSASGPSSRDRLLSAPMPVSSVTGNRDGKHAGKAACLRVTRLQRGLVDG